MKRMPFLALFVLLAACTSKESQGYIDALSGMIRGSNRIVVTEHSFELDVYDVEAGKSLIPEEVVYRTVELSQAQREMFLASIELMDPKTQDAFAACIFEPHHTVRFYSGKTLLSTMQICFQCSQVEWAGTTVTPPWSLYDALGSVIREIGLEPEREWTMLAQRHLQGATATRSRATRETRGR